MIIEIEGYGIERNTLISGKKCSISKLCWQFKKALFHMEDYRAFIDVFCRLFQYERVPYDDLIEVDFIIDLDTSKVYKPIF